MGKLFYTGQSQKYTSGIGQCGKSEIKNRRMEELEESKDENMELEKIGSEQIEGLHVGQQQQGLLQGGSQSYPSKNFG